MKAELVGLALIAVVGCSSAKQGTAPNANAAVMPGSGAPNAPDVPAQMGTRADVVVAAMPQFVFTVAERGRYALHVSAIDLSNQRDTDTSFAVYDSHNEALVSMNGSEATVAQLDEGTYHARVVVKDGVRAKVSFEWSRVVTLPPAATLTDVGSVSVAKPASTNGTSGSVDVAFNVSAPGRFNLRIGDGGPMVSVLRAEDEAPLGHRVSIQGGVFILDAMAFEAGRYLLRIEGTQDSAETFQVTSERYTPPPPTARMTDRGRTRVEVTDDANPIVELTVSRRGTFAFRGDAMDDGDPKFSLSDATGREIAQNDDSEGHNPRITIRLDPGVYTLEVQRFGFQRTSVDVRIDPVNDSE